MSRRHILLLRVAATDRTFVRRGREVVGKCIHCGRKLAIRLGPTEEAPTATLEHIVPKNHGGDDSLENLAVACRRCNSGKGHRLDHRRAKDPVLKRVIETLLERRRARWRPPADWSPEAAPDARRLK